MKKTIILLSFFAAFSSVSYSQVNLTCGQNFYDDGGVAGDYSSNAPTGITYTICPGLPTEAVQLVFSSFNTEGGYDLLTIYNNNVASGQILDTISGIDSGMTYLSENPSGCLTAKFLTDGSTIFPGWEAIVNCVPKPTCLRPLTLTLQTVTHVTSEIAWTSADTETQWTIEYGPTGFALGTGTEVITSSNPYLIEGLDNLSTYDVYVRANCGWSDISEAKGPLTFQTLDNPFPAFVCGNLFTDNGGANDPYYNYTNDTIVICPSVSGQSVSLAFSVFDTEQDYDSLVLYNGNSVLAPIIDSYSGIVSIGTITSTSTDGCLTAVFNSDEAAPSIGWSATINCISGSNTAPTAANDATSTSINTAVVLMLLRMIRMLEVH